MNILTLDPMYSPLHSLIAKNIKVKNKYAILTSLGLSVYLPGFKRLYINKEIETYYESISNDLLEQVERDLNHFTAMYKKIERENIPKKYLEYMAAFAIFIESFILESDIDLVLLHNDLRWQHSLCINICKRMGVKYLVTEQGLFRPNTTVVDLVGVNAYSNVASEFEKRWLGGNISKRKSAKTSLNPTRSGHNSNISYLYFFIYLVLSKLGGLFNTESLIVHNRHGFLSYLRRFFKLRLSSNNTNSERLGSEKKIIFVPLQLELDTQILVHSRFNNNQSIIDYITKGFESSILSNSHRLVFKLHPNDTNSYIFGSGVEFYEGSINSVTECNVTAVVCVNSSSVLELLDSNIPIILLGESIYDIDGVTIKDNYNDLSSLLSSNLENSVIYEKRLAYLDYLKEDYCINGAGFNYPDTEINKILTRIGVF